MDTNYERFMAANTALFSCMEATDAATYSSMSPADQNNVCANERAEVASFLKNDSIAFKNILAERIASLSKAD